MVAPLLWQAMSVPSLVQEASYERAISACEGRLNRAPLADTVHESAEPYAERLSIRDDLEAVYAKYGRRARTLRALGECCRRLCQFEDAENFLQNTLRLDPDDALAKRLLYETRGANRAGRVAASALGKDRQPISVELGPDGRWYVLSAVDIHDPFVISDEAWYDPAWEWIRRWTKVRISQVSAGQDARVFWTGRPLSSFMSDDGDVNECTVVFKDLDGDGRPECLIWTVFYGGSILPQWLTAYRMGPRMIPLGTVGATEGLSLQDIDQDGVTEIEATDAHWASELSHAGAPRWTDIHQLGRMGFRVVNKRFPREFLDEQADIGRALKELRGEPDPEVRLLQAKVLDILGQPGRAAAALNRADRDNRTVLAVWLKEFDGKVQAEDRAMEREEYRERRERIAEVRRGVLGKRR